MVSHDRENKHDFVKTVPDKCWNLCVFSKTSLVSLYRCHCIELCTSRLRTCPLLCGFSSITGPQIQWMKSFSYMGVVSVILKVHCITFRLIIEVWALTVKLLWGECHVGPHQSEVNIGPGNGLVPSEELAIIWASIDPDLCRRMASQWVK